MTDTSGQKVWSAVLLPFGESFNVNEDVDGNGIPVVNNLRFPGQYYDAETGLHYNMMRDYNPQTGRYIESDPIGLEGGINTFTYVGNNPVNWVDPFGLIHAGFIKQVAKMANKSLNRTIRSLEKQIAEHESKNLSKHHKHELRIFKEQLKIAKGEAKSRGLSALGGIGLAGSGKCENMSQEEAEEMTENRFDWLDPFWSPDYAY